MGTTAAVIAGEIARRSAFSLGHDGLAQRTGHRTAIELVRVTTGLSGREAAAAVRVGTLVQDATDPRSWRHVLGQAVGQGFLSVGAADSIRAGLGEPSARVSEDALAEAVERLCSESETLDTDRLFGAPVNYETSWTRRASANVRTSDATREASPLPIFPTE